MLLFLLHQVCLVCYGNKSFIVKCFENILNVSHSPAYATASSSLDTNIDNTVWNYSIPQLASAIFILSGYPWSFIILYASSYSLLP